MIKSKLQQPLLLAVAAALILGLYFWGDFTPVKPELGSQTAEQNVDLDIDNVIEKAREKLTSDQLVIIDSLNAIIENEPQNSDVVFLLADNWREFGDYLLSAEYFYRYAEHTSNLKNWVKAGNKFLPFMTISDTLLSIFAVSKSMGAFDNALEMDSNSTSARVGRALVYIDGQSQVMQGVQILLNLVEEDPENTEALLVLGRLAVVSAQYEKALKRLDKVIQLEVDNLEAHLLKAEALETMGRKEEAVETLMRCRSLTNDKVFQREIDRVIKTIRNS